MTETTARLSAWMAAQRADADDVAAYARRWLVQPGLEAALEDNAEYFRQQRDRAVRLGNWARGQE
jgi:hypothetical protein